MKILRMLALGGGLMLAGCMPEGSGKIVSEPRTVEDFTGVEIDSGLSAEVTVTPGAASFVTVVGDDNLLGYVETEVDDGVLVVHLPDATINPNDGDHLRVLISAPALGSIEASGAADVTARGLAADALKLTSSGSARLAVFGDASSVDAHASGGGSIEALSLTSQDVVARGDGNGNLEVCAEGHLDLHLSGGSHLRYGCGPTKISQDVSGGSSVEAE